ncbi:MAG: Coenzyme F420 hydrogenase/dehydrogenase, beta subunit C-terminal domain [Bacteroidales bacterium]|jgi:coenzyme F420 hydrogenase subunit beta
MNYTQLQRKVIKAGLCTHCGTCAGLDKRLEMTETRHGPVPLSTDRDFELEPAIESACPGIGIDYARLNRSIFGKYPQNWLIGNIENAYIGYSGNSEIRLKGASGGVITQILLYLLEKGEIQGAVVLKHGVPQPWLAQSFIARTSKEIIEASQSVYAPIPVNTILDELNLFNGKLAFVGLPDQVASIRQLQNAGHPAVKKIKYIIGPYVGINMYASAVLKFARTRGIKDPGSIREVKYRDGEWPGCLKITTHDGRTVKAEKFYYNYLLPFYITRSTLYSVDFANDLTDISVGDAWSPQYEKKGKGFAVVIARKKAADAILQEMKAEGCLKLERKQCEEVLNMHGHMFDFKKRGAFVRMSFRKVLGRRVPDYDIAPYRIGFPRYLVELVIFGIIKLCSSSLARGILQIIPVDWIGPFFNASRKGWKGLSKPTKRKGLMNQEYKILR